MAQPSPFQHLVEIEDEHLKRLHEIVLQALNEQQLLTTTLRDAPDEQYSFGERLADRVATFGGSWTFLITFGLVLALWIGVNAFWLRNRAFDPYPFILLNLILSCLASVQAPIIMMSQNRKEAKDRKRGESDYLINLKAEIEIRNLHDKIDLLIAEQMRVMFDIQKEQLEKIGDLCDRMESMEKERK